MKKIIYALVAVLTFANMANAQSNQESIGESGFTVVTPLEKKSGYQVQHCEGSVMTPESIVCEQAVTISAKAMKKVKKQLARKVRRNQLILLTGVGAGVVVGAGVGLAVLSNPAVAAAAGLGGGAWGWSGVMAAIQAPMAFAAVGGATGGAGMYGLVQSLIDKTTVRIEQIGAEREFIKALKATDAFTFLDSTPGSNLFHALIEEAKNAQ